MSEKNRISEPLTKGSCIDLRYLRETAPKYPTDLQVDDNTYDALVDHVAEGMYELGIKYHGITPRGKLPDGHQHEGINCVNQSYRNIFIHKPDNYFHVFVISPF